MNDLNEIYSNLNESGYGKRMPLLFIGHGSPMNAIEDNEFSRGWEDTGKILPRPKAILSVSAHWVTPGATKVTAMENPKTIYDFYGFPEELYKIKYPAPGSPEMALETTAQTNLVHISGDNDWGLDHGTWSVLLKLFPSADVPVFQLSLDYRKNPEFHFTLASDLKKLREKGIMVLGSGNMVHNLRALMPGRDKPFDWALEFDNKITRFIEDRDFQSVSRFLEFGNLARMAHPTYEHFLPLIYALGFADRTEEISFFNSGFDLGSVSMKSMLIG